MRHSSTGSTVRLLRRLNNFVYNKKFNAFGSTFSFDFLFDPKNREHAEMICVTHLHEAILYYTTNTDPNYLPKETEKELTGYMMRTNLRDPGTKQFVKLSGFSKPAIFGQSDIPPDVPTEFDGVSLKTIIERIIPRFKIKLIIKKDDRLLNSRANKVFVQEDPADDAEDDEKIGKTASEPTQNIASYLSGLARQRNIVISHDANGDLVIARPNTKSKPILTFDFTDSSGDYRKIPGVEAELDFNGQGLHTHIVVKQEADDEEDSNAVETSEPLRNPLVAGDIYIPKTHTLPSGDEFSVNEAAKYELGKEIRENIILSIKTDKITIGDKLIGTNESINVRHPELFLYTLERWFIQSIDFREDSSGESAILNNVLPFGYDFDYNSLKNVFVNPHENLPRT